MKRIIKMGLVPIVCLCLVFSCDKDSDALMDIDGMRQSITSIEPNITQRVESINGLLKFEDGAAFDDVVDYLDRREDKWLDAFLLEVSGYTTEELDDLTEEELDRIAEAMERQEQIMGISGDYTYEVFEDQLNFKSLRDALALEEEIFLGNEYPDWDNNPDDHYISGTAERTLFNSRGEIMVGEKLYKIYPNGLMYEVTDGDFETLWALTEGYEDELFEADNVEVYNEGVLSGRSLACRSWVKKGYSEEYQENSRKYQGNGGHRSFVFSNRAFSTIKHYKKVRRKWKKRRAHLKTSVWGQHGLRAESNDLIATCDLQSKFDGPKKAAFRRKLTSRYQTLGVGLGKIESEKVKTYHEANGHRTYFTIIF